MPVKFRRDITQPSQQSNRVRHSISLRDVIAGCRDLYVSKYLVHYTRITSQSQPGGQVTANTLTTNFKKARDKTDIDWRDGTPATRN